MCLFITATTSPEYSDALAKTLKANGFGATPLCNPTIKSLETTESVQYLTTRSHCDCDTALGVENSKPTSDAIDREKRKLERKLRKKSWSDIRKTAYIQEQLKAFASFEHKDRDIEDLKTWENFLTQCFSENIQYIGLILHMYNGHVETEIFDGSRRVVRYGTSIFEALKSVKENELTIFRKDKLEKIT